tara:strand:+ start:2559 stop:3257 length:699 start_codon:yes stop_codon:yes gene_type:complete
MKIAVLFDGAGLARLGLEQAGHDCTGFELNPMAHRLGKFVGSGNVHLSNALHECLDDFDAVWASPPCQWISYARTQGDPESAFSDDYLEWSLNIKKDILWVENVYSWSKKKKDPENTWGKPWNAAQVTEEPIQSRVRIVGGKHKRPKIYRPFKLRVKDVCPTVTATEGRGTATDKRRASRFYGRRLTIEECAYHQGLEIPEEWYKFNKKDVYAAIGNGVPVYMAKAFGKVYD